MVNLILGNRFPSDLFICHSFILLFLVVIYKCFLGFLRFPKYLWKFHENVSYGKTIKMFWIITVDKNRYGKSAI